VQVAELLIVPVGLAFIGYALWMYRHRTAMIQSRKTRRAP